MDRIADRLRAQAALRFVGRQAETAVFWQALRAPGQPTSVLIVHGPGGIGKTALIEHLDGLAAGEGVPVLRLDARDFEPTASGLRRALCEVFELDAATSSWADVLAHWPSSERRVLIIDTFELLAPVERWLRDHVLAELPQQTLVVLAGRHAPGAEWTVHPLWQAAVRALPLDNFDDDEASQFLQRRGLPPACHGAVQALSYGHPLALGLLSDVVQSEGEVPAQLETDLIRRLTECFAARAPSPLHRAALELCASARSTTQDLIAELIGEAHAAPLFEWLASLSFVQAGPHGLFPHDLVRDAIVAELGWRDPTQHHDLVSALRDVYVRRLRSGIVADRNRTALDIMFLQRVSPIMRRFFDFASLGQSSFELARPHDREAIEALAREEKDPFAAETVGRWWAHPAAAWWLAKNADQQVIGTQLLLDINALTDDERRSEPCLAEVHDWLSAHMPARAGEVSICAPFFLTRGGVEPGPALNALQMCGMFNWLTEPRLAAFGYVLELTPMWRSMMGYVDFREVTDLPLSRRGIPQGLFVHDWRTMPPDHWIAMMTVRAQAGENLAQPLHAAGPCAPLVLSQEAFEQAVREALKSWTDAQQLALNPLTRTRMVHAASHDAQADPVESLKRMLRQALDAFASRPRDQKFRKALELTYFQPAGTQEQVAERLGLPFGTYRYQLSMGIERLIAHLWQVETGG